MATPTDLPETRERAQRVLRATRVGVLSLLFVAVNTFILLLPSLSGNRFNLEAGQVAQEDILAPRRITYVSRIETEIARDAAEAATPDVYDPPNARVGRQQVLLTRQIMEYASTVRHDTLVGETQRLRALEAIDALELSENHRRELLDLTDAQFDTIADEVIAVLDDVMSGEVREDRMDEIRAELPLRISVDLSEENSLLVMDIVEDVLLPNSTFNADLTNQRRADARSAVSPVEVTFASGEVIVRDGDLVTASDIEALTELGLVQNRITLTDLASRALAVLVATGVLTMYLWRFYPPLITNFKNQLLGGLLFIGFLLGARLMVSEGAVFPYLYPAAALALLTTALFDASVGVINAIVLAVLSGFIANQSLEFAVFVGTGGLVAAVTLRRAERVSRFFLTGLFVGFSQAFVILIFRLLDPGTDFVGIAQLVGASMANGLFAASLSLAILYVFGPLFRLTTSLTLIELERPDHPLLLRLQREAPGTYQHTLQVRNLAEACAAAIGANSLLARVGALYHDVGKARRPQFFVENRVEGSTNPHDTLDPYSSAEIIIRHVVDGIELAKRERVPAEIHKFIREHHGSAPVAYFYHQAKQEADNEDEVDESQFRYPGPPPQSRETALLMICDASESAVRANQPKSEEEIDAIVARIIQQRLDWEQFTQSGLTLGDLTAIRETIVATLKGVYHPRIKYPGDIQPRTAEKASDEDKPSA